MERDDPDSDDVPGAAASRASGSRPSEALVREAEARGVKDARRLDRPTLLRRLRDAMER